MSRSDLVDAYISGLSLTTVAIVGAGKQCRIITGEPPPGEPVAHRYLLKPAHAELLLSTIGTEGLSGQPAAALASAIEQAALRLGAKWQTPEQIRKFAGQQVDEIVERIRDAGHSGKLKTWNSRYKQYRLSSVAKGETALGYAAFIERVVALPLVRDVAVRVG